MNLCVLSRTMPQITDPTIPQTTMVNPIRPALISSPFQTFISKSKLNYKIIIIIINESFETRTGKWKRTTWLSNVDMA